MKKLCTLFFFVFFSLSLFGQDDIPNKAKKYYDKGVQHLRNSKHEKAKEDLLKALDKYPSYTDAHMRLGELHLDKKNYKKALERFEKVIELDKDYNKKVYFYAGQASFKSQDYAKAINYYEQFLDYESVLYGEKKEARWNLKNAKFRQKAKANPVPFEPKNLGDSLNSKYAEYLPSITADEQTLIFTRRLLVPKNKRNFVMNKYNEDFYYSHKKGGKWQKARNLGNAINTRLNEGAQTITPDGKFIFFTACNRPNGFGSCDIYIAKRNGRQWSKPVNLGPPVSTKAWESQPAISPDGKSLYFSSNRKGGQGKMDLWVSHKQPNGAWSKPENLGEKINSKENEESAFMHMDNKTFYFSSNGRVGMGKEDLYMTTKQEDGSWSEPKNLGYPINTEGFESSIIINAKGNRAYFASDRFNGKGSLDLYYFPLHKEARPNPVTYVKGKVFDAQSKERLEAKFKLLDLKTGEVVMESISDAVNGEFLVCLPSGKNYALNVSKRGYLFYSEHFSLEQREATNPVKMDIPLQPLEVGKKVVLKNIFFATDSYRLKEPSKVELHRVIEFLQKNPNLKVRIAGHTDNQGSDAYNLNLSKNRAKSVYNYLIEKGIPEERLTYKGYGESKPVAPNNTQEGRAKNRRTEFVIIGKM